ncbi:MAG TPA: peptide-methionine (S)-S-oxide reductase MsrA [Candidatus Nanoarchaeia archaeon]|nr:peptide-methionine (S)-S-oxide reductase MsrA [Candidatus Nanoarchaeia archaeon]
MKKETNFEMATFAAGCFWGVEAAFRQIKGVKSTRVGYTGGQMENPTYEDVCADETGHAEAVEVTFDPKKLPYEKLLDVFWQNHNPTLGNRQGPDVGTQYRSAIFYHNKNQKELAINSMNELQKKLDKTITTEIKPAEEFYEAEDYHQQYLEKRGMSSCHI